MDSRFGVWGCVEFDWKIIIASVGAGIGFELIRRYRGFKTRRRSLPAAQRNGGFWNDRRLYLAELVFAVLTVSVPFSVIIVLTSIDRPLWAPYACLLAYSALVFLLMKSLNTAEPQ